MLTTRTPLPAWAGYAGALAVTAAALGVSVLLSSGGRLLLAPLIGAVAVSVWLGGAGPAVLSLVAGFALANLVLADPTLQDDPDSTEVIRLAVNIAISALVIALGVLMRRALRRAEADHLAAERARADYEELLGREARARERLDRLQRVTADLARALTPEQVADAVTVRGMEVADAQASALLLLDEDTSSLTAVAVRGYPAEVRRAWARIPLDARVPAAEAVREARMVVVGSSEDLHHRFPDLEGTPLGDGFEALVVTPLLAGGRRVGALGLRFAARRDFGGEDLAFLSTLGQLSAAALARARRYASEHEVAEVLQRSLLPSRAPEAPGLDLAVRYVPGAEDMYAGGDWYAALPLASGRVALGVGDVVGHGMHAAAAMGRLRGGLLAYATEHEDPGQVLALLSRLAARAPDTELSTAAFALVEPASGEVRYACAGHPPPLVAGPAGPRFLEGGRGRPLGFFDDDLPVGRAVLGPGESLVLYSDGLFERRGEDVGTGLARLLDAAAGEDPDAGALATRLLEWALGTQGVRDDVALLVARPAPPGAPTT